MITIQSTLDDVEGVKPRYQFEDDNVMGLCSFGSLTNWTVVSLLFV